MDNALDNAIKLQLRQLLARSPRRWRAIVAAIAMVCAAVGLTAGGTSA